MWWRNSRLNRLEATLERLVEISEVITLHNEKKQDRVEFRLNRIEAILERLAEMSEITTLHSEKEQDRVEFRLNHLEETLIKLVEISQIACCHFEQFIQISEKVIIGNDIQKQNLSKILEYHQQLERQFLEIEQYGQKIKTLKIEKQQAIKELTYIAEKLETTETEKKTIIARLEAEYSQEIERINDENQSLIIKLKDNYAINIRSYDKTIGELNIQAQQYNQQIQEYKSSIQRLTFEKQKNFAEYRKVKKKLEEIDTNAKVAIAQVKSAKESFHQKFSKMLYFAGTICILDNNDIEEMMEIDNSSPSSTDPHDLNQSDY